MRSVQVTEHHGGCLNEGGKRRCRGRLGCQHGRATGSDVAVRELANNVASVGSRVALDPGWGGTGELWNGDARRAVKEILLGVLTDSAAPR